MVSVRAAAPADHAAIDRVVDSAFGRADEAAIVRAVRAEGAALVELVAEDGGGIVGHILFSRMGTASGRLIAGLGPMAVTPGLQRGGVGKAMGQAGVAACRDLGVEAIVVLGHPAYYPRFGFSAETARTVVSPFAGRSAWMAMELRPGVLEHPIEVAYPAAFG